MKKQLVNQQVKRTTIVKGKREKCIDDFNYSTGNPFLDLYAFALRQAIRDYCKLPHDTYYWATAKSFIEQSPISDKIFAMLERNKNE